MENVFYNEPFYASNRFQIPWNNLFSTITSLRDQLQLDNVSFCIDSFCDRDSYAHLSLRSAKFSLYQPTTLHVYAADEEEEDRDRNVIVSLSILMAFLKMISGFASRSGW